MVRSDMVNVLVACEFSGRVRDAFSRLGCNAWSCDFLPSETDGHHHTGDVSKILDRKWDIMIGFPPCTYLCSSGMHWTTRGLRDPKKTEEALKFVKALMGAPIPHIAIENPVGAISTRIRKPDFKIQPWMFGENASKKTCFWTKDLPPLKPTKIIPPKDYDLVKFASELPKCECCDEAFCVDCQEHFYACRCYGPTQEGITYKKIDGFLFGTDKNPAPRPVWANQTPSGQNKLGPSEKRWKDRSETYFGIAEAIANQWLNYYLTKAEKSLQ